MMWQIYSVALISYSIILCLLLTVAVIIIDLAVSVIEGEVVTDEIINIMLI